MTLLARPAQLPVGAPRMRILYFNYEWDLRESSGAATHIRELTAALETAGHEVIVSSRHRSPQSVLDGEMVVVRGKDEDRRWRKRLRSRVSPYLHESAALARAIRGIAVEADLVRRVRPDVVLTRYSLHQFSSLVAARRCGIPIVFEVNAPLGAEYRRYLRRFKLVPGLAEWTEASTLGRADAVVVVSSVLKDDLVRRGVDADRVHVAPNGADPERFRPDLTDRTIRDVLGERRTIVGFVGSFASFHGIDALRAVVERIAPARPDVAFLMVGAGPQAADLSARCRASGVGDRLHFTGFVPPARVPEVMATADVLLAPYGSTPLFYFSPIKLFEYLACGRAVVAARVGQVAEVITHGHDGLLYEPDDLGGFAHQILRLADDPELRRRLGGNARLTFESRYTWRHNAERVAETLEAARRRSTRAVP